MKKVINGRQYNTDTAKYIDGVYSGIGSFEEYKADLYKKRLENISYTKAEVL